MQKPDMELIVAVDEGGGIGRNGSMLYSIPEDLKRFKSITMGKVLLMGRGTFFSLPGRKPLPGRINCVLSRNAEALREMYPAGEWGPFFYPDEESFFAEHGDKSIMVIGGGEVYAQFMPMCSRAYVTEIGAKMPADAFFRLDGNWKCVAREPGNDPALHYDFCIYER